MKFYRLVESSGGVIVPATPVQTFTDPTTGFTTTDIYDVDGDIVRVNTSEDSLVWDANGMSYSQGVFPVLDGIFLGSNRFFQVRFGTENGQRKAFFTETAAGTICDIRLNGADLQIFATSVQVPNP